jgi:RNA polymerase sigma-70 factor, ECF subfamily
MDTRRAPDDASEEITALLVSWSEGDRQALDRLMPVVHTELRRLARRHINRERRHDWARDHTLQPTALVHEVFLRLTRGSTVRWQDRAHFYAMAATLMRRILVDHARARLFQKRGGGAITVPLDEARARHDTPTLSVVALDDALTELARLDPRKSRVIELRFFGGLSLEETAEVLQVSIDTVKRDARLAKVWLRRELDPAKSR